MWQKKLTELELKDYRVNFKEQVAQAIRERLKPSLDQGDYQRFQEKIDSLFKELIDNDYRYDLKVKFTPNPIPGEFTISLNPRNNEHDDDELPWVTLESPRPGQTTITWDILNPPFVRSEGGKKRKTIRRKYIKRQPRKTSRRH